MPTIDVAGIDLYYERSGPEGDAHRLLFFNGSGATLATTGILIKPFAERFDVVAHDQRGMGQTSIPPGPYTMADYAADGAALLDHLGWDSCRVVGVSFGGMVAQEFAVTFPERVERLALACTSPGGSLGASYPLHELADLDEVARAARLVEIVDTRFTPEWLADHPDQRALADFIAARRDGDKSDESAGARPSSWRPGAPTTSATGWAASPAHAGGGRPLRRHRPVPNSEAIAARVPGADLRVYEGGHMFFIQDPTAMPRSSTSSTPRLSAGVRSPDGSAPEQDGDHQRHRVRHRLGRGGAVP